MKIQFNKIFALFPSITSNYNAELSLLLDLILFRISVWSRFTTYGNHLQGLKFQFSDKPKTRNLTLFGYLCLNILIPYVYNRISQRARQWVSLPDNDPKKRLWYFLSKCEEIWKYMVFINFLVFLYDGKYVTFINRLLGLRLDYRVKGARMVSFEFMNRQLLWDGFTEFMFFIMPLINLGSFKEWLSGIFVQVWRGNSPANTGLCSICGEPPKMPHCDANVNGSRLQFCYYCIKKQLMEQNSYLSPDGHKVVNIRRVQST